MLRSIKAFMSFEIFSQHFLIAHIAFKFYCVTFGSCMTDLTIGVNELLKAIWAVILLPLALE